MGVFPTLHNICDSNTAMCYIFMMVLSLLLNLQARSVMGSTKKHNHSVGVFPTLHNICDINTAMCCIFMLVLSLLYLICKHKVSHSSE